VTPWEAKPLSVAQIEAPPVRLIYPTNGVSVVLNDGPAADRRLQLKLSGLNAHVRVYLNGEPLPADDLLQSRLAVPADGTYELKVIGVNGLSDRAEFTVISQSLF
jgi:membrane carboxypeptidase/penicillin-binding protein PbpC